ncbi:class II aldolase/adducin family protein [Ramlibacter sp. AW1]|uniref:Class II aldolase/adducin family protein n=1 Tax=Ramlibacter aurantiacus TaxID=2801330 RepID=A0A936ZTU6_9BURK|nr:class II aldolase/adducin family protein [Ramlibacter aurantiacus]MBL0423378.1 class II aldolase/adducin family protein [Ramlibacter aurantiacus]
MTSPTPSLRDALQDLSLACRILELEGHGDMSLGHVSLRDPGGRGFWMKRNRIGLGEVCGPADFVLVDFDGVKLEGEGGRHSEWPIHSEILRNRPDVQVVAHTHPFYCSVLSASSEPLLPFTLDTDYFIDVPKHVDDVALITTKAEGQSLARSLGEHFAVLMGNHGLTFCGGSIAEATCIGVFVEKAAKANVVGRSAGFAHAMPLPETRTRRRSQIMTPAHIEHSWNYFKRKLAWFLDRTVAPGAVFR